MGLRAARILIVMLLMAIAVLPQIVIAHGHDSSTVVESGELTNSVHSPATDGQFVAWVAGAASPATSCNSIRAAALDGSMQTQVATIPQPAATLPAIAGMSNGIVVWSSKMVSCQDYGGQFDPGVYGKNLLTDENYELTTDPANAIGISGTTVTWATSEPGEASLIRMRNIDDNAEPATIATLPLGAVATLLYVRGSDVYWLEQAENGPEPRIMRASAGDDPQVVHSEAGMTWYDIHGDTLVWRSGTTIRAGQVGADASEAITIDESGYSSGPPATDGRYVFWIAVSADDQIRLQAYDLVTGSGFTVVERNQYEGNVYAHVLSSPHVGDGVLVWDHTLLEEFRTEIHAATIADILPSAPNPPGFEDVKTTYFEETGHYLGWGFRDYWQANGGLAVFGFPTTEEFMERNDDTGENYNVQFTERQRFEWHPENEGTPYEVLLGRLGAEQAGDLGLLETEAFNAVEDDTAPGTDCLYFATTGHYVCDEFLTYWQDHGLEFGDSGVTYEESLALFGYPLSEPFMTTNADGDTVLTQYFERAVFEHHPQNQAPFNVLLRRLGVEVLTARDW